MRPVLPPSSQPCLLPFPPDINPPINKVKKDRAMMIYVSEDSEILVNLSSKENTRLKPAAIINIVTTPYIMAELIFLVSIFVNSLVFY